MPERWRHSIGVARRAEQLTSAVPGEDEASTLVGPVGGTLTYAGQTVGPHGRTMAFAGGGLRFDELKISLDRHLS